MLFGEGESLAFVEGHDENTGLWRLDNGCLRHGFGRGCSRLVGQYRYTMLARDSPMALSVVGVTAPALCWPWSFLSVMVEVDGEREKGLKGPRWVSFSSVVDG